jgi:glycosidase
MENASITKEHIRDLYGKLLHPFFSGRDGYRTPMHWNSSVYAGFSNVKPWLPVHPNYHKINIENQMGKSDSVYSVHKRLIELRKKYSALQLGNIEFILKGTGNVLAYERWWEGESLRVFLNFSFTSREVRLAGNLERAKVVFSTHSGKSVIDGNKIVLKPFQGVVVSV